MKKTKIINSRCPEFGYELLSVLPYAYNLYLKGELEETISAYDTSCLYFFSPKHTETSVKRSWDNMNILWKEKFPNINIHRKELDWEYFSPPPLKDFYKEKSIKFEKETIVIFNRYNKEWGEPPINFLDTETLDTLFGLLSNNYQIIYINFNKNEKYFDHSPPIEFDDDSVLKKHPNVITIYDVSKKYPELSLNELQLRIFANCSKFISSNGGQLILSAYFGGENIIFSKKCRELDPNVNSFYRWYHKIGGGVFQHVNDYKNLIDLVKQKWVLNKPMINVLIRTSNRPNYFNNCINSVYKQTYKNWNIIIGVDNDASEFYAQKHRGLLIRYNYDKIKIPNPPNNLEYGIKFKYNFYLNDLQNQVKNGYVIYLDDDDELNDIFSLEKLVNSIKDEDTFIMWRVKFPNRLVPSDQNFGNPPVIKDVSSIGFSFHIKYKQEWEPYKRGDYRVSKKLYKTIKNKIYINEILTKLQRPIEDGYGMKDDIGSKKLSIIIPTYKNVQFLPECFDSILKSIRDLDCEILVGIDNCQDTLKYINNNTFDSRFKFYLFEINVGPYVIKNSLTNMSLSNKILFFDSDDIMTEDLIPNVIGGLNSHKVYRPMYVDFIDGTKIRPFNNLKTNHFGYGVIGIDKETFLSLNGFEGWRCEADNDFLNRLNSRNIPILHGISITILRRIHKNGLTSHPNTNYKSQLREQYRKLSSKHRPNGKCEKFETANFIEVKVNGFENDKKDIFELKKEEKRKLLNSVIPTVKKETKVDYNSINSALNKDNGFTTKSKIKEPVQNLPKERKEILEKKKESNYELIKKLLSDNPNKKHKYPDIEPFRKKN